MEKIFLGLVKEAFEIEGREISLLDKFREYEEWSSLSFLSFISMIDEEYDVIIEAAEFRKLLTLGEVFNAIQSHK